MEFKVNSKVLEKLLAKVIPAVPARTPMPILENFLFEIKDGSLTVCATDLEISLKSSINVASDENVSMVIPARLLYDIIRSLQETHPEKSSPNSPACYLSCSVDLLIFLDRTAPTGRMPG